MKEEGTLSNISVEFLPNTFNEGAKRSKFQNLLGFFLAMAVMLDTNN